MARGRPPPRSAGSGASPSMHAVGSEDGAREEVVGVGWIGEVGRWPGSYSALAGVRESQVNWLSPFYSRRAVGCNCKLAWSM
jgi:hypothetical protein